MGYYTDFKLKSYHVDIIIIPDGTEYDRSIIQEFFDEGELYEMKWYDHEKDMKLVSLANPNVVFHTSGVGEEQGDIWEMKFLNGKSKTIKQKTIMPSFDDVDWSK